MTRRLLIAAVLALAILVPASASAAEAPAWRLGVTSLPTHLRPGTEKAEVFLYAANVGAAPVSVPYSIADTLPDGVVPTVAGALSSDPASPAPSCHIEGQTVSCEAPGPLRSGHHVEVHISIEVDAGLAEGTELTDAMSVEGGGIAPAGAQTTLRIESQPPPFGLQPGPQALTLDGEGLEADLAATHPYAMDIGFELPTERHPGGVLLADGHLHDIVTELPRGLLVDPAATPVRCTEAELVTDPGCPEASAVGTITAKAVALEVQAVTFPVYNMVPPPGVAAELGMNELGVGVFQHIDGSVRTDSDYGIVGTAPDTIARTANVVWGVEAELWGDPGSPAHDAVRALCGEGVFSDCPVPQPSQTAMLTLPGDCSGMPLRTGIAVDSWEQRGTFHRAFPAGSRITGCNQPSYEPTIGARPTTNLADSPSGLDFTLHQPQDFDKENTATAELKDARVTLPEGLVANPSQADGLGACSQSEIGYLGEGHYSKQPQSCPDASKLGTMEVSSPLLAEFKNGGTEPVLDPETGEPIPRPLQGAVYLAKPFENQFGSLLAIYLVVEDEQSGIVAKLAGKVEPDPGTGQLTTVFEENPELPLEYVKLHLFGGARASLTTPISCGTHTTASTLTPWSAPEGLDAHPSDSFQTTAEPGGGTCPGSEGAAQNKPAFQAGTLAPQAGAYSPFVLKLAREDGSQRIAGIDTTLPPGLSGRLAGIAQCSEGQIAGARAREKSNEGILEKQNPSCPASSEVGTVDVAAGAGPTPFHTQGHAYLAGPYRGAPLSLVAIVPAVAGPFDLGAVVSRVALHVDPDTAQIHAVSDPLPQILDGIPLDVRSIALTMGRPEFTLNPTSCEPMQIAGSSISALGQSAALSNPFQVGGCPQLPFKPKLTLKLKGGTKRTGHPKLIASLKAKPGEANVAMAQVKLPPSAFLDQAHIRTVCTRVQFAANDCPSGSIYGKAEATTPLLAYPLSGNVYLRSSSHKLPDLVVALKGPDYQPIEIDLDGKTDSVRGSLRNTFEAVPDAPVSSFRLELLGGKRGLVVNSRNLCAHPYKAEVNLTGQNGKVYDTEPVVGTGCGGAKKHRHKRR